jgi:putative Holliday junction resolvase
VSILGLDVGDRRIGLALAEEGGTLAVPIGAFERTSLRNDLPRITEVLRERKATLIVAGLPISINGTLGPQAKKTQRFLDLLKEQTQLPVEMVDERYSSSEAGRLMQAQGAQPSRHRGEVDSTAATIILQAYLDQQAQRVQPTHSVTGT